MRQTRKEYKTRHDWVEEMIPWELGKRLKFNHSTKWYKPESVLENVMHKILWYFEIQIDHLTLTRRPDIVFINQNCFGGARGVMVIVIGNGLGDSSSNL